MSTLALCPSRGRPAAASETLASFLTTRRDPGSRLVFIVDRDDPTLQEYPSDLTYIVEPMGSYVPGLNTAAHDPAIVRDATSVGFVGDDNRFRTPGWDLILDGWLAASPGIAYGDDGFQHERLPTSWWISRKIVDVFGMADPGFRHLYPDNYWKALGEGAGCLRYFPDVSIEHLHPHVTEGAGWLNSARADATYKRGNSPANIIHDRSYFARWMRRDQARDVTRLRALIASTRPRRVLADWHHPALWESLSIMFEDRFGWELYSPLGIDWTNHGWTFQMPSIGWTADDYLVFPDARLVDDHFELVEREYPERPRKMLTWDQARASPPDVVLASVAVHQRPFSDLARRWGARFVHQVGNARHVIDRNVPATILASAVGPRGRNVLPYHPEFDRRLFDYTEPGDPTKVTSFMLRASSTSCDASWLANAADVRFSEVGGLSPRDPGYLTPMTKVAARMRESGWTWHDKSIGDGYGFVLHQSIAMGRPLIGHASHYKGQLGERFWRDLDSCIDLDRHPVADALRLWRAIGADPEWHADLSARTAALFDQTVKFNEEAEAIRAALA